MDCFVYVAPNIKDLTDFQKHGVCSTSVLIACSVLGMKATLRVASSKVPRTIFKDSSRLLYNFATQDILSAWCRYPCTACIRFEISNFNLMTADCYF